jgi:prevent-host-death family protein
MTVNLYEAKASLSKRVERAAAGEEIIIAKAGKPKARLVALADRALRKSGGWEGKVWVADDFDEPLPPEILEGVEGKELNIGNRLLLRRRRAPTWRASCTRA